MFSKKYDETRAYREIIRYLTARSVFAHATINNYVPPLGLEYTLSSTLLDCSANILGNASDNARVIYSFSFEVWGNDIRFATYQNVRLIDVPPRHIFLD